MAEIAVVSSRKNRLKQMATEGNENAKKAYILAEKPSYFLSTSQIGITIISILAGAIGDNSLVHILSVELSKIPFIEIFHSQLAFLLIMLTIAYLNLIFGELVPKRIALSNPEKIASNVAPIMSIILNFAYPVIRLLSITTEFIFKLLNFSPNQNPPITEEEIRILIREGADMGIFNKTEKHLVERALLLDDLKINMLMTPRNKIEWFDVSNFDANPHEHLVNYHHSRILFADESLDKIVGVTHVKDLLKHYLLTSKVEIRKILTKPLLVPENTRALKLLEMFRHSPIHIALAIDEFGNIQGLITLNDVLEALIGDIKTQNTIDPHVVKRNDGSYLLDGMVTVSELKRILKIDRLPNEESGGYQTVGGFAISFLDSIPKTGDTFVWNNFRFEIIDMDDKRVDKILVSRI
jgi:putative hemolysin